jgi:hypothetical protein
MGLVIPDLLDEQTCDAFLVESLHPRGPRCPGCRGSRYATTRSRRHLLDLHHRDAAPRLGAPAPPRAVTRVE